MLTAVVNQILAKVSLNKLIFIILLTNLNKFQFVNIWKKFVPILTKSLH